MYSYNIENWWIFFLENSFILIWKDANEHNLHNYSIVSSQVRANYFCRKEEKISPDEIKVNFKILDYDI